MNAESEAIKKRGDITEWCERQVRLSIAQRVSDAAQGSLAVREQAEAQERVNALMTAGLIPTERAADLVRDQIADLPLLAALQVAQPRGHGDELAAAKRALDDQPPAPQRKSVVEGKSVEERGDV